MKKSFLIAGVIAGLTATNSYAAITISQDDAPDITISVARAGKIVKHAEQPKASGNYQGVATTTPQGQSTSNSSPKNPELMVKYSCREGCTVSVRDVQDDTNPNTTMGYTTCVNSNNEFCGFPSVEEVGILNEDNVATNVGIQQRKTRDQIIQEEFSKWNGNTGIKRR